MTTAFIFPGQGAQYVGMGKDLNAGGIFDSANEILGYDLKRICFEGPAEELVQTKYSQPAILVTSIAYLNKISEKPGAAAGLSLGEYTALICAGALSFSDGLRLVRHRAEFMQEASTQYKGGMASVIGMDEEEVREIIGDKADIANLNCPGQVVISGLLDEIEKLRPFFKKMILLDVSGAFHSRYMESAKAKLEPYIMDTEINVPRIPFFANVTGRETRDPDEIRRYLVEQVTSPVYWERTIRNMTAIGIDTFKEVGPGNVLTGLLRRINVTKK